MTMPARRARRSARVPLVFVLHAAAMPGPAQSPSREVRTYLDVEYLVARKGPLALRPFARVESRFRSTGLVYEQWNAGLRLRIRPWLSAATYYTPRELLYPGKASAFKDVAGADVVLQPSIGSFRWLSRATEEWHATEGMGPFSTRLQHCPCDSRMVSKRTGACCRGGSTPTSSGWSWQPTCERIRA